MESQLDTVLTPAASRDALSIWSACLSSIQGQVPTQSFKTWFEPVKATKLENGELTVQVPSQFFYEWLEEHYYSLIKTTISRFMGEDAKLTYVVVPPDELGAGLDAHPSATIRIENTKTVPTVRLGPSFSPTETEEN